MTRALAVCVVVGLLGLAAFGTQFSGTWDATIHLLPVPALEETSLEFSYVPVAGWTFTSASTFTADGFASQLFEASGSLGAFELAASLDFSPIDVTLRDISYTIPDAWTGWGYDLLIIDGHWTIIGPSLKQGALDVSWEFAGVSFGVEVSWQGNKAITLGAGGVVDEYLFYLDIPPYDMVDNTMVLQPHPTMPPLLDGIPGNCYSKYFGSYARVGLVATEVTFEVRDINTDDLLLTHTVSGEFEVYYYDDLTGTVILTFGADTYLWQYFNNYLVTNNITFPGPVYMYYTIDPADVEATFLFPSYMTYTLTMAADPFSATIVFDDVCTGIQFKEATITLTDLSLCCGITYDAELHFTKCEGFDYIKFSADLFELCCDISFGVDVTFGVDYKKVKPKFSWAGIEGCVTVWGDVQEKVGEVGVEGWELYGYKIFCELAECYSLEFVTAFNVSKVEDIIGDVFKGDEFEYISIGACGPACCGGTWTLDATIYFDNAGGLFGISRFAVDTEVPIMDALTLSFSFESPDTISVGWEFTF